ncbi:MAG: metallophosphatase family protein [Spirochaetes bacterium]|jgi:predicted phosphodiesterase|nr:metallophosphatase family protein [Spirochaetota bacterium]
MILACIADIHANAVALEAVLRDMDSRGIERIVCAGDVVGFGPFPNEVIALLRERRIPTVMGNYDAKVLRFPDKKKAYKKKKRPESYRSFKWTWESLSRGSRDYLAALPFSHEERMDGVAILMTHGSMRSYRDYIPESTTREELESLLAGHAPDLFIVGHTHVPFFMQRGTVCVAGCGSAGKPVEGTADVSYVIVRNNDGLSGEIVRVAYDVERLTRALIENGLPEVFAAQFRGGTGH